VKNWPILIIFGMRH